MWHSGSSMRKDFRLNIDLYGEIFRLIHQENFIRIWSIAYAMYFCSCGPQEPGWGYHLRIRFSLEIKSLNFSCYGPHSTEGLMQSSLHENALTRFKHNGSLQEPQRYPSDIIMHNEHQKRPKLVLRVLSFLDWRTQSSCVLTSVFAQIKICVSDGLT